MCVRRARGNAGVSAWCTPWAKEAVCRYRKLCRSKARLAAHTRTIASGLIAGLYARPSSWHVFVGVNLYASPLHPLPPTLATFSPQLVLDLTSTSLRPSPQIRGSVYREWTLDPRPITKPAAKRHHHLLHTLAAPTPGTQLTGPSQTQGQQQPFAFLAGTPYSQSQAHVAFAAAAGAAGAPQQGANGPMGHLNGLYQQRLTVGAPLGAAVAAALAAGDVDKAAAAALRGPAAAVGGMGLTGWCEELEAVVERAAAPMAAQAAAEAEDAAGREPEGFSGQSCVRALPWCLTAGGSGQSYNLT